MYNTASFSGSSIRLPAILTLLLAISGGAVCVLSAQQQSPTDSATERAERLSQLRTRSRQNDIATATYLELQQLAREWGLDPNQSSANLRLALYNKLKIPAPSRQADGTGDLTIKIDSARKAQVFTIERTEDDSEDYFKISGGVRITISDQREGYQHSVSADSIVFNRPQNTIRAEGAITYTKQKLNSKDDKDAERFTGDSLVFRLRSWRGVIFYGVFSRAQTTESERPADVHSSSSNPEKTKADPNAGSSGNDEESLLDKTVLAQNEIRYYFDGEKIRKGSDEILVLEKGEIATSDKEQNKYFGMGFHRLWIFGEPEWAMLSATLYVGNIPVLYLPYYYHNDSQLLFHPVFGLREAYGEFIQTTTYLLGKPEAADTDSLSFLPVSSGADKDSDLKLNALYLVAESKAEQDNATSSQKSRPGAGSRLKFLLDYYSYMGLFTGFDGVFKNLAFITNWELEATMAYAFALEERSGTGFATGKPFILDDDGHYRLKPVETRFLGQPFPFRYGIDTDLSTKNNIFSIDFQYYSDPFYRRDYFNRKESFDWLSYALERVQRDSDSLLDEWRKKNSTLSSFKWEAKLNLKPRFDTSLISSFNFSAFASANFSKKNDIDREPYDPTREFFYPTKFFLPDTNLRISGTIWPLRQRSSQQSSQKASLPILRDWKYQPPSEDDEETDSPGSQTQDATAAYAISGPKELQKIRGDQQVETISFRATYNLSLRNLVQSETESALWRRIEDVELNNKELQLSGKEAFQLVTEWKFLDNFLSIRLKHNLDFNVRHYFDITDEPQNSNDLTATKQANKWNWNEESAIALKPLQNWDWFANSSITHTLKLVMYDHQYNLKRKDYDSSFLDLDADDETLRKRIPTHRLVSLLDFQPIKNAYNPVNNLQARITFTNELPPAESKNTLKNRLFFEIFRWSHDLSIEFTQSGDDDPAFYAQPLNYTSIYKPLDKLEFKNVFIFNFEAKEDDKEPHVDREEISFKAWWFSGGLFFRHTQPYQWDKRALAWKAEGDPDLLLDKAFLSFELTTKDHYFWKNRILFYFTFKTRWDQDMIRYNRTSSLTLDFTFSFFIHEFLNLQISYRMSNEKMYLYYPGMRDLLGFTQERFFLQDLVNSLSFWDESRLKQGLFNMKDLRILAIHHLKDWDLIFEFVGKPKQVDGNLTFDYALGFYLRWIPIPLIKRRLTFEDDSLRTDAR